MHTKLSITYAPRLMFPIIIIPPVPADLPIYPRFSSHLQQILSWLNAITKTVSQMTF